MPIGRLPSAVITRSACVRITALRMPSSDFGTRPRTRTTPSAANCSGLTGRFTMDAAPGIAHAIVIEHAPGADSVALPRRGTLESAWWVVCCAPEAVIVMKIVPPPQDQARADLAAAFRWAARLNWHESIANHFSVAISEDRCRFLMNPNGRHFSRVRASELLLLDA